MKIIVLALILSALLNAFPKPSQGFQKAEISAIDSQKKQSDEKYVDTVAAHWEEVKTELRRSAEYERTPMEIRKTWSEFRGYVKGVTDSKLPRDWIGFLRYGWYYQKHIDSGKTYPGHEIDIVEEVKVGSQSFRIKPQFAFNDGSVELLDNDGSIKWSTPILTTNNLKINSTGPAFITKWLYLEISPDGKHLQLWAYNQPSLCSFHKIQLADGKTVCRFALKPLERVYQKELDFLERGGTNENTEYDDFDD